MALPWQGRFGMDALAMGTLAYDMVLRAIVSATLMKFYETSKQSRY